MKRPDRLEDTETSQLEVAVEVARKATSGGAGLPVLLADEQLSKLRKYLEVLLLWRRRASLIATSDPVEIVEQHILDAFHVVHHVARLTHLADIGSGAGLPGIPLAIAAPSLQVALVESRRRRANFLREARRQVGLENVEVIEGRAEDVDARFGAVVCRAVGPLHLFLDLAATLLKPGGVAVAMKGAAQSVSPEPHPAFELRETVQYELRGGRQRSLLVYSKRQRFT